MECNVYIKGISVYHPEKIVDNDEYIKKFKATTESELEHYKHVLVDICGRDKRYEIDNSSIEKLTDKEDKGPENTLTMIIEAAKNLLNDLKMGAEQIDGIIVANQIPEHYVPADSVKLHAAIKGRPDCFTYDINCNCMSMVMAMVQGYLFMNQNQKMKNVLVVGGDYLTQSQNPEDPNFYGTFGDAACAVMLSRTKGNREKKLFDFDFLIENTEVNKIIFPECGISNVHKGENTLTTAIPLKVGLKEVVEKVKNMLYENSLEISDIKGFCFTQFTKINYDYVTRELGIDVDKAPFVSPKYGYTGPTSPFLALYDLIENNKIQHGDYLLFWTFGAGVQHIFTLVQY